MKNFHVESFSPLAHFNTPDEALASANMAHKKFLASLPFDISLFFGRKIIKIVYCLRSLSVRFSDKKHLHILLDNKNSLTLAHTTIATSQDTENTFNLIFPDGDIETWNPQSFLEKYETKSLMNLYSTEDRMYLYFSDCDLLISVSILNVVEPPYKILRVCESD